MKLLYRTPLKTDMKTKSPIKPEKMTLLDEIKQSEKENTKTTIQNTLEIIDNNVTEIKLLEFFKKNKKDKFHIFTFSYSEVYKQGKYITNYKCIVGGTEYCSTVDKNGICVLQIKNIRKIIIDHIRPKIKEYGLLIKKNWHGNIYVVMPTKIDINHDAKITTIPLKIKQHENKERDKSIQHVIDIINYNLTKEKLKTYFLNNKKYKYPIYIRPEITDKYGYSICNTRLSLNTINNTRVVVYKSPINFGNPDSNYSYSSIDGSKTKIYRYYICDELLGSKKLYTEILSNVKHKANEYGFKVKTSLLGNIYLVRP